MNPCKSLTKRDRSSCKNRLWHYDSLPSMDSWSICMKTLERSSKLKDAHEKLLDVHRRRRTIHAGHPGRAGNSGFAHREERQDPAAPRITEHHRSAKRGARRGGLRRLNSEEDSCAAERTLRWKRGGWAASDVQVHVLYSCYASRLESDCAFDS